MKRTYESVFLEHFAQNRQMLFLVGPRQVGKTTVSLEVAATRAHHFYLNWDDQTDRKLILEGAEAIAKFIGIGMQEIGKELPLIIFDELHKYRKWKNFIKGFFDKYSKKVQIIVTGSARLDIYKVGGDSLMGRYFLYRLHPLSVGEILQPAKRNTEIIAPSEIKKEDFDALFQFGGFPDPFLQRDPLFYNQWKRLRFQQLFTEDLRDLTLIQDLGQMQVLAELLQQQAGCLTSYQSLANKVNVSVDTVKRWIQTLKSFYYCFTLQPWTKNISRSLLKIPKLFLWDWSLVEDEGARKENFIASHLLKAVHFWTDRGFGDFGLYFLRDKEKREVDFLVSKNKKPWFLVEVKSSENKGLSKSLFYYQNATQAPHAFQVVFDRDYIEADCFSYNEPVIVPAKTFLSQLL
jgi:predicted AAA+ superfamily ATPase